MISLQELLQLFEASRRRWHLVGNENAGVVAGLDLEGRLYTVLNGIILNRVNPAVFSLEKGEGYVNPGGDGLWPAPEGTALGYEYPTGKWRVPPGLTGARYYVTAMDKSSATIRADVDLINNRGRGIPTVFERNISVEPVSGGVAVKVVEAIEYLGVKPLPPGECLLVPWTLAQFDCGSGAAVVFPNFGPEAVWDLYDEPSDAMRTINEGLVQTRTDGSQRYQIGIAAGVPWIEFRWPQERLSVRRQTAPLPAGCEHVDISDVSPDRMPGSRGVRYSVYSDRSGFMEIEAAGGVSGQLQPGGRSALEVTTTYRLTD